MEAKQVFEDAQRLLKIIISSGSLKGHGLVGFWHAQSSGDDINVYKEDVSVFRDTKPIATFHCLRQQVTLSSSNFFFRFLGDENSSVTFPTVGEGHLCFRTIPMSVRLHCARGQWSARLHWPVCCGDIWS